MKRGVLFANEAVRSTSLLSNSPVYSKEICSEEKASTPGPFSGSPKVPHRCFPVLPGGPSAVHGRGPGPPSDSLKSSGVKTGTDTEDPLGRVGSVFYMKNNLR